MYGTTTTAITASSTQNPYSAFGGGNGGAPRAISNARNTTAPTSMAAMTKAPPMSARSPRLAPWTISAPHPRQTIALFGTGVWQCGHTNVFTDVQ
jgi:hypothetical protein